MKRTFLLCAAATTLALSACGAPEDDPAPTSTVTKEVIEENTTAAPSDPEDPSSERESEAASEPANESSATPSDDASPSEPEQPDLSEQTPEDFQALMVEEMRTNGNVGDTFTIDGQATELCVHGDGFGLNVVTAGANTSCEFASNLLDAATEDINPTQENIRDTMPQTLEVASPVTNQQYQMDCSTDARNLITCTGGDNAVVYMY